MSGRTRTLLLLLLAAALALAACAGGGPEENIVGEWSGVDNTGATGTIEFQEDGTVIIDETLAGEYTIVDDGQLELEGPAGTLTFDYELEGDTLTLSNPTGSMTFQRVFDEE